MNHIKNDSMCKCGLIISAQVGARSAYYWVKKGDQVGAKSAGKIDQVGARVALLFWRCFMLTWMFFYTGFLGDIGQERVVTIKRR